MKQIDNELEPTTTKRILIVEDESVFAKAVSKQLTKSGYINQIAGTLAAATTQLTDFSPDLILLDMRLPDGSGLEILNMPSGQSPPTVIVMSAYGELEDAVSAMKLGAADYLKKPIDLKELLLSIERVLDKEELTRKLDYSSTRERHASSDGSNFLGKSEAIQSVRDEVQKISRFSQQADRLPPGVLLLGETGTGKDLVARFLHANSGRSERPFVHVDCAALPKELIESELFGHEKGAFTGANSAHTGLIEAAEDGTLFLDEIGELSQDLQAKLLAVLERRVLRRVGTTQERAVHAWIIAATNRDIELLSKQGEFRADLYFRLNVLSIHLPALAERGDDILLLAQYFANHTAKRYGLAEVQLTPATEQALLEYPWPGNVREIKHLIERAVLLSTDGNIDVSALALEPAAMPDSTLATELEQMTLDEAELLLIKKSLARTKNNVSKAARELGVSRMALRYRMQKYDL